MNERVLFVDDDRKILHFAERSIGQQFDCVTASTAEEALEVLRRNDPVAVIVSDDNMPGIRGTELLAEARKISPDTTRVMLTGYSDQTIAVDAVNKGAVFRFLNKPVRLQTLLQTVKLAVRQYELVTAERELLDRTLGGTIATLTDILALARPEMFGRTERLRRLMALLAPKLPEVDQWQFETAARLSQIGGILMEPEVADSLGRGDDIDHHQARQIESDMLLGADLVRRIPRLEAVAEALRYQYRNFDGSGPPEESLAGEDIPLLGRALHLCLRIDALESTGLSAADAVARLRSSSGCVDPRLLDLLVATITQEGAGRADRIPVAELQDGMVIEENVTSEHGMLLVSRGQTVTPTLRRRLAKLSAAGIVTTPVLSRRPAGQQENRAQ